MLCHAEIGFPGKQILVQKTCTWITHSSHNHTHVDRHKTKASTRNPVRRTIFCLITSAKFLWLHETNFTIGLTISCTTSLFNIEPWMLYWRYIFAYYSIGMRLKSTAFKNSRTAGRTIYTLYFALLLLFNTIIPDMLASVKIPANYFTI